MNDNYIWLEGHSVGQLRFTNCDLSDRLSSADQGGRIARLEITIILKMEPQNECNPL